ncbi:MAG: hypothetical protein AAFR71_14000 [Pseudomonadota bacterium]
MITDLTTQGWLFIGFFLAAGGFFIGSAMDGVLGVDGFGPLGNMSLLVAGSLVGGIGIEYTAYKTNDPTVLAVIMVSGAFVLLGLFVITKLGLNKLGA